MDKIYYLSHRSSVAIKKSGNNLNGETLFCTLEPDNELEAEADEVFGEKKMRGMPVQNCHDIVCFVLP